MSPACWGETSHLAVAVIVTRAHCCLAAAGHCYVMLGTIKFVDKSVNQNIARRLDHCDVIALRSGFGVDTGVPHSEVELQTEFKSFTAAHFGIKHKPTQGLNTRRHMHQIQQVSLCPLFSTIRAIVFFNYRWGDNAHWISKNKMDATVVQWELCGTNCR